MQQYNCTTQKIDTSTDQAKAVDAITKFEMMTQCQNIVLVANEKLLRLMQGSYSMF